MRKAQASAEFLYSFAATLLLVATLSAALISHKGMLEAKAGDIRAIGAAESAARAVEAAMNAGIRLEFGFDGLRYRVEGDSLLVQHGDGLIEKGGVFHDEDAEPV
jgi:hypothetical protein